MLHVEVICSWQHKIFHWTINKEHLAVLSHVFSFFFSFRSFLWVRETASVSSRKRGLCCPHSQLPTWDTSSHRALWDPANRHEELPRCSQEFSWSTVELDVTLILWDKLGTQCEPGRVLRMEGLTLRTLQSSVDHAFLSPGLIKI